MTSRRASRRDQAPRFLRHLGPYDVFKVGHALMVVPTISEDWPAEVKNAIDRRRRANLSGRCDCGAHAGPPRKAPDGLLHATMAHEADCPSSDEQLGKLLARHGMRRP